MKVKELIKKLNKLDQEAKIQLEITNGEEGIFETAYLVSIEELHLTEKNVIVLTGKEKVKS